MISRILMFGSLISSSFVIKCNCSIGFFLMSCLVAFHYRSYGTFFLHKNRLHNIHRDLPTTNIIEPNNPHCSMYIRCIELFYKQFNFILFENLFKPRQLRLAVLKYILRLAPLIYSLILVQYPKKRTLQSKILLVSDLNNCSSGN